jgi:hypothetical protein
VLPEAMGKNRLAYGQRDLAHDRLLMPGPCA